MDQIPLNKCDRLVDRLIYFASYSFTQNTRTTQGVSGHYTVLLFLCPSVTKNKNNIQFTTFKRKGKPENECSKP